MIDALHVARKPMIKLNNLVRARGIEPLTPTHVKMGSRSLQAIALVRVTDLRAKRGLDGKERLHNRIEDARRAPPSRTYMRPPRGLVSGITGRRDGNPDPISLLLRWTGRAASHRLACGVGIL